MQRQREREREGGCEGKRKEEEKNKQKECYITYNLTKPCKMLSFSLILNLSIKTAFYNFCFNKSVGVYVRFTRKLLQSIEDYFSRPIERISPETFHY